MKLFRALLFIPAIFVFSNCREHSDTSGTESLRIVFEEEETRFSDPEKQLIRGLIIDVEKEVSNLLPELPDSIQVTVEMVDWDIEVVGGVTGQTESNRPPHVAIQVSNRFTGGITGAVHTALRPVVFHEFHHLYRGWAINDNKFEQGISIAVVNEGLAVVFSEVYTQQVFAANSPPEENIAHNWVKEIMALPRDADYQQWMFEHPDGRLSIGYRTGNFLIRKAMVNSGKSIIELSTYTPDEIFSLAGYSYFTGHSN